MKVPVVRNILEANEQLAQENKTRFQEKGLLVLNLMSSPGAGKTTLLERTIEALKDKIRIAVIEGDIQSTYDAEKIAQHGVPAVQINTDGACHLDSRMIQQALKEIDLSALDLLVVENVGNLVCPAEFDVGEDYKVMILSVTEGDDKPLKYPLMFSKSSVLLGQQDRPASLHQYQRGENPPGVPGNKSSTGDLRSVLPDGNGSGVLVQLDLEAGAAL